ncbi:16S rRNA (uracil(1498)-N(3))-methyltransferase [Fulvimarina sp. 2208YS6-2-32]|uniref:Ribosomal RNA small subunit methyltransferase E n=1 Tax=Fulvimarina uroteuthidis TaxID=3098149 RepID=A0ABU5HYP6_9HYPH|nr:16S rRNA (uracil(1498)-N(3))-methyltransferase [Fulvimarina sp. 2208YS6-2-32]MDY8108185.1 16S rRNA (uracil(1498)-N(3))-methyltransferase [Fulvimarina sp. 2208YS6-2-32]
MPDYDFKSPRLFTQDRLDAGAVLTAGEAQTNYLLNVLRKDGGDEVLLFNGVDGEWRATLRKASKKKLEFVAGERIREQTPPCDLVYCFAPLKVGRLDYMVQKAVEMGAGVLQPVLTDHTQTHRLRTDKMRANAVEAAEQCGILTIPECREPLKFGAFLSGWNADTPLVFCDERMEQGTPVAALEALGPGQKGLLIGPEGGFSPSERAALQEAPFATAISLGPRILRADTAAVAALALLQAVVGDWKQEF